MIKALIFDFGDVFINLDKKGAMQNALDLFSLKTFPEDLLKINTDYETGHISTETFINVYTQRFPHINEQSIINAWNYIIKDFPKYRLEFLKNIKAQNKFKLILLSNTNALHIELVKHQVSFYEEFKNCFDAFYLSHEIGLRKPNASIFKFVLENNLLLPEECLFIDDTKENTDVAKSIGIYTWNIDETKEDVIQLFETNNHLF